MKELIKLFKVLILCVSFEVTAIATQHLLWQEDVKTLFYIGFGLIAYICYMYKEIYIQFFSALLTFVLEVVMFLFQTEIISFVNSILNSNITNRNIVDNYLMCIFIQFTAFVLSLITSYLIKRSKNSDNID